MTNKIDPNKHYKLLDHYEISYLCRQNNWFTHGSIEQYDALFNLTTDATIHELAIVIWVCSDKVKFGIITIQNTIIQHLDLMLNGNNSEE